MAAPTWIIGQVLSASDVNTWFVPRFAYKTASTSRTSTTTLAADPHLIVPVDGSAMYELIGFIDFEASVTGDMKFQFTLPASATMNYAWISWTAGADLFSNNAGNTQSTVNSIGGNGAGIARGCSIQGTVTTAASGGNLGVNWAQDTSSATATIWHAQSYLKLVRVG
jgi:hypothetical protein